MSIRYKYTHSQGNTKGARVLESGDWPVVDGAAISDDWGMKTIGFRIGVMGGDEALKIASGARGTMFGRDLYYISIMGKPSTSDPWMIQFGGHHLALNITMVGREGILTPSHTAAQPVKYMVDGKTVRPLGA